MREERQDRKRRVTETERRERNREKRKIPHPTQITHRVMQAFSLLTGTGGVLRYFLECGTFLILTQKQLKLSIL